MMNGTHRMPSSPSIEASEEEPVTLETLDARLDKREAWEVTTDERLGKLEKSTMTIEKAFTGWLAAVFNSPTFKLLERLAFAGLLAYAAKHGLKLEMAP
jgi:hypothetical protein